MLVLQLSVGWARCGCRSLSDLSLRGCVQVTSDRFDRVVQWASFAHLDLFGCDNLDGDRTLRALAQHVPRLE